jgi:predicted MPP superfamily phosphohydrolase
VIGAILKQSSPDFVVQTGDLVANGADTSLWPIFFDIERQLLRKAAFFAVLGNHERNDRNFLRVLRRRLDALLLVQLG